MEDKKAIQAYVNDFRRHMSRFLKKGVGLACKAYPSKGDGGVIEFKIGPNLSSEDEITEVQQSINDVLKRAIGDVHWIIGLQTISCMTYR